MTWRFECPIHGCLFDQRRTRRNSWYCPADGDDEYGPHRTRLAYDRKRERPVIREAGSVRPITKPDGEREKPRP